MKLLAALFFISFPLSCTNKVPSLKEQTQSLYKQLYSDEKLLGLTDVYVVLEVKHPTSMHDKNVWGDVHFETGIPQVEVLALEDFPEQVPWKERKVQQIATVRHELLHIFLYQLGVPGDAQDEIIYKFQPLLKEK